MDTLIARLMGNEMLIQMLVKKFAADGNYAALVKALDAGDAAAAEHASHTLKGMCGNMSLDTLFALFTEQVNHIRAGRLADAAAMMAEITPAYECAVTHMRAFVAES